MSKNNLTETRQGTVAKPTSFDEVRKRAHDVLERHYEVQEGRNLQAVRASGLHVDILALGRFPVNEKSLPALDAVQPEAEAALAELKRQARPATLEEVVQQLAKLVRSFPTSSTQGDISGYGSELLDWVVACKPAIGDLDEARRHLVLTCKWIPTINEVIPALAFAKFEREELALLMASLATGRTRIIAAMDNLAKEQAKLTQERAEIGKARNLALPDINNSANDLPL